MTWRCVQRCCGLSVSDGPCTSARKDNACSIFCPPPKFIQSGFLATMDENFPTRSFWQPNIFVGDSTDPPVRPGLHAATPLNVCIKESNHAHTVPHHNHYNWHNSNSVVVHCLSIIIMSLRRDNNSHVQRVFPLCVHVYNSIKNGKWK